MGELSRLDALYFKALASEEAGTHKKALKLFNEGAALGDSAALHAIGCAYDSGKGVKQNKVTAIKWFKKAWRASKSPLECNAIALTYAELGRRRRAIFWWQKAVDTGDGTSNSA